MEYEVLLDKYQDWYEHAGCAVEEAVLEEILEDFRSLKLS